MNCFDLSLLAYLDPFTGSLILQAIFAVVIGAGVMLRKYLFAPIRFLRRRKADQRDSDQELYE